MMEVFEGVPDTSEAQLRFISKRASKLCVRGKGLLVMSETADEMGERFEDTTFYNVAEERRMFRSMLVSHPQMETTVTGVLLHEETVSQNVDRRAFPQYIESRGAMVGVRADRGVAPIPNNTRGETWTVGISDLFERLHTYHTQVAFTLNTKPV
jgi:fructose-bisphosphate aldolase class I